jgi:hypothetical protein
MDNKQNKNNPAKNDPNRNPDQGQGGKMDRDERSGEKLGEGSAREGSDVERRIDDDNLGKNSPRGE